jgi:hypothetical protein
MTEPTPEITPEATKPPEVTIPPETLPEVAPPAEAAAPVAPVVVAAEVAAEVVQQELPPGRSFPIDAVPAKGGEIVQLISMPPAGAVIVGLVLSEDFEVTRVFLGNQQLSLPECTGKAIPAGPGFVIVLARNLTKEPKMAEGAWYLTGELPPEVAAKASTNGHGGDPGMPSARSQMGPAPHEAMTGQGPLPAMAMPLIHTTSPSFSQVAAAIPAKVSTTVTPGQNEVAVLLQKGEAQRLIAWLTGKDPVTDSEKWGIIRQLTAAIMRQEGRAA